MNFEIDGTLDKERLTDAALYACRDHIIEIAKIDGVKMSHLMGGAACNEALHRGREIQDLRDALKLSIGRDQGTPWEEVSDKDVDSLRDAVLEYKKDLQDVSTEE